MAHEPTPSFFAEVYPAPSRQVSVDPLYEEFIGFEERGMSVHGAFCGIGVCNPGRRKGRPCGRPSLVIGPDAPFYWSSLVTSCCMLLACAKAEMPVWLRISYLDMFDAAEA
jgi:hypothetical protein